MATTNSPRNTPSPPQAQAPPTSPAADRVRAWELVEQGRYRPLRTRGSFPGRELG